MSKEYVYLAGPITGFTFTEAQDWRTEAAKALDSDKIETLTPMRGKDFLVKEGVLHSGSYGDTIASSKGITRRDMNDTTRSSVVLVNLLGATKVSIGTVMEIAWAYNHQIPCIVAMEKDNVHRHAMIEEATMYRTDTLKEAIELTQFLLNDVKKGV